MENLSIENILGPAQNIPLRLNSQKAWGGPALFDA
jgi:hypothetical protein